MKLYLLRHGKADWPEWEKPDDERPLTKKGRREVRRVAKMLCKLKASPRIILTSPLPRAQQTAEIAAKHLCVRVHEERALGKGFSAAKLREMLKRNKVDELMIVGHEPDFSAVIRAVTGGDVELAKAGVARVDVDEQGEGGRLNWLLPPKLAKL